MRERRFRSPCVILNPRAASGKAQRKWPKLHPALERELGPVEVRFTEAPNHATELARGALESGSDLVVAVGGDGTLNEVVNGYFVDGAAISREASIALCPIGTGGDFRRCVGIPNSPEDAVKAIAGRPVKRIDACRVRLRSHAGDAVERYCLNVASFGLGGEVSVAAKNSALAPYSGQAAFLWSTAISFLRYRAKPVELAMIGQQQPRRYRVMQVAVGNGEYHGGGMHVCPRAALDSGTLEVTVIEEIGFFNFLRSLPLLYSGRVYEHPKCHHFRATALAGASEERVAVEVDGEAIGTLPLEAEVLPGAVLMAGIELRS